MNVHFVHLNSPVNWRRGLCDMGYLTEPRHISYHGDWVLLTLLCLPPECCIKSEAVALAGFVYRSSACVRRWRLGAVPGNTMLLLSGVTKTSACLGSSVSKSWDLCAAFIRLGPFMATLYLAGVSHRPANARSRRSLVCRVRSSTLPQDVSHKLGWGGSFMRKDFRLSLNVCLLFYCYC